MRLGVSAVRRRNRSGVVALAFAGLMAMAGMGCRPDAPVARALEASGVVERGHGDGWSAVVPGTAFEVGDTIRTGAAASARVDLLGSGIIRIGERARVRFQLGRSERADPAIAVELGSAEVDQTTAPVSIITSVGPARIERGAHVRVRSDGQVASLEVVVGRAVMLDAGREVPVGAGEGVRIRLGSALFERFAVKVGRAVVEPRGSANLAGSVGAAPSEATGEAVAAGLPARSDGPVRGDSAAARGVPGERERADVTLDAGESATVHDGRAQVAVRLRVATRCPGEAIVSLAGRGPRRERSTTAGTVVLRLRPGRQSYDVRCIGEAGATSPRTAGVLSVRRDTGNVPLPGQLPINVIDADGRRYTVLFQTRLPKLMLAWPAAPKEATTFELHLDAGAGARVIERVSPTRPLPPGTVSEGTYTFWYQTSTGVQSPRTTLTVRFDNVAPTAQFFRAPAGAGTSPPGVIPIDGVTVEGATVSVGGQPVALDAHGRFRVEATPLEGDDAVSVRLQHPRTGVHYYVRRRPDAR